MTTFADVTIGASDRKADVLRVEVTRNVSAVGSWKALLRNTGGVYNNAFDVQNFFRLEVNNPGDALMHGVVESVQLKGRDLESIWDEYAIVSGVDRGQDLLFHNDFEHDYPNTAQDIDDVLDDIFNVHLLASTNIAYITPFMAHPVVGAIEFREGASFLGQIQELMRRAGWIFYVDDGLLLRPGIPGWIAAPAPSTFRSILGDPTNNIIDVVDVQRRDGDKHYNYVKLYGKSPMFDAYTELNATSWTSATGFGPIDDTATVKVGDYSQVTYNANPVASNLSHDLTLPKWNYASWDLSKGEIGVWARYDNTAGAPGTPGAGSGDTHQQVECRLFDGAGTQVGYRGDSTWLERGYWGYCRFPLGDHVTQHALGTNNEWSLAGAGEFLWNNVVSLHFFTPDSTDAVHQPSHFYIDGLSLPIPIISIQENLPAQFTYRRRPYIDAWPHVRTQNAMDSYATQLLSQSESTSIKSIKFITPGTKNLRYAGQTINVDIPPIGTVAAGGDIYYITSLHHVVEPYGDVSGGFGFDWVVEVEALPVSGVAYDQGRLRIGPTYSAAQSTLRVGAGVRGR